MTPASISVRKIAIFRARYLSDMLCAIPAIRALRYAYPYAEITLLGLPWAAAFVQRFAKYIDRFVHFPGYPGLPEQPHEPFRTAAFLKKMRGERFDLLLQMQDNGDIVNEMLTRFNATDVAGFYDPDEVQPGPLFIPYPDHLPEIHRHLALVANLGVPLRGDQLDFPITEEDARDARKLLLPVISGRFIIVHPGARGASRQWPPALFAALADYCIEQGFSVLITGIAEESDITTEMIKCMKHKAIDLCGKTTLGALAWLIRDAYALIANCTGVSHIAAAVQARSLVVNTYGEPNRWAPLNKRLHTVVDASATPEFERMLQETVRLCGEREAVAV